MSVRCPILLNQRARALRAVGSVALVERMAREAGLEAEVISTTSAAEMVQILRTLVQEGAPVVTVAGGDGTLAQAVQVLAYSHTALGILPQGTANNFATALRVPHDLPSALRVVKEGIVHEVGLGKVGDRYFTEAAGVGLFADALALYGAGSHKNLLRATAALARVVLSLKAHRLQLTIDGQSLEERSAMCIVANSYRMWLALPVAPRARLTDDHLDVVLVNDVSRSELITYYRAFRAQLHPALPKVRSLSGHELRIESRRPLNVHADDQVVGETPVTITSHPRALKVLVDRL